MKKAVILLMILVVTVCANQISIHDISQYDPRTMTFTVTENYEVKRDDILIIPAGSNIQFAPLTGIDVKGELVIDGKPDRPVTLTSRKAMQGLGAPYDWKGITLFPSSNIHLSYTVISYASFGIKSCCDNVTLVNAVFFDNGVNFQIGDRRIYTKDREPVYYEKTPVKINISSNPMGVDYDAIAGKSYIPARTYVIVPLAAACLIAGPIYISKWNRSANNYNDYKPGNSDYDRASYDQREKRFDQLKNESTLNAVLGIGLTSLGLVSGAYITIYTWRF